MGPNNQGKPNGRLIKEDREADIYEIYVFGYNADKNKKLVVHISFAIISALCECLIVDRGHKEMTYLSMTSLSVSIIRHLSDKVFSLDKSIC